MLVSNVARSCEAGNAYIEGGDGLPLGVLSVCDRVADDLKLRVRVRTETVAETTYVLKEDLEDTAGLLVDETGDTLHTTTTRETTDGGLGDTCKEWCQHNHNGVRGT